MKRHENSSKQTAVNWWVDDHMSSTGTRTKVIQLQSENRQLSRPNLLAKTDKEAQNWMSQEKKERSNRI